jgi:hypothetical protein
MSVHFGRATATLEQENVRPLRENFLYSVKAPATPARRSAVPGVRPGGRSGRGGATSSNWGTNWGTTTPDQHGFGRPATPPLSVNRQFSPPADLLDTEEVTGSNPVSPTIRHSP